MSTTVVPTSEALLALSDDEFRSLVNRDLFRKPDDNDPEAEAIGALLRQRPVLDRWYWMLHSMMRKVESQLATKDAEVEALKARTRPRHQDPKVRRDFFAELQKAQEWRTKTLHFKTGLEQVYLEARRLFDTEEKVRYDRLVADERWVLARRVGALEDAIRRHRDGFPDDDDPSDLDQDLWALLPD